jgi:AcrR family transcriptional regulator
MAHGSPAEPAVASDRLPSTAGAPTSKVALRQQARRRRVLKAALEMAAEGGYEAVQMRELADRARVSLTTLYRDFASKDELLAVAWADWTAGVAPAFARRPLRGDTMAERAIDFFHRTTRALERQPQLAAAILLAANSTDPRASRAQSEAREVLRCALRSALEPLGPEAAETTIGILNHVWNSALQQWVSGRLPIDHVYEVLEKACRLMLDPYEPSPRALRRLPPSGR